MERELDLLLYLALFFLLLLLLLLLLCLLIRQLRSWPRGAPAAPPPHSPRAGAGSRRREPREPPAAAAQRICKLRRQFSVTEALQQCKERTEQCKSVACDLKPGFSYQSPAVAFRETTDPELTFILHLKMEISVAASHDSHGDANGVYSSVLRKDWSYLVPAAAALGSRLLHPDSNSAPAPTRRTAEMAKYTRGTVTAFSPFDARADAEALRKAMKGMGTDEETILKILTSRNNAQRQEIASAFKTLFGRDLVDDLKSELTGKFETLMVSLMRPASIFDAHALKHAIKGAGTNEKVLTEILASRTPAEVRNIKQVYMQEYEANLEDKITGETSGHFQRLLVVLLQANRDPDGRVDEALVEKDAQVLFRAGELKWGTDEETFITILGTRSVSHLRRVFDKYMTISGFQIEETIDRETSGDLEKLLLAVVKCIRSVPAYFAETLYYSMKGAGTDDDTLIRVMVSRSEIDLLDIRHEFRKNFAKSLHQMIQKDTSGDYRKALLLLCGGDDE